MKKLILLSFCLVIISTSCSLKLSAQDWAQVGSGVNGGYESIKCMTEYNGELYIAGNFTIAGGIVANHIAKWNGLNYSPVGSGVGVTGTIYSMCIYNGELYAAGPFTSIDGINCPNGIAKWNGTNWSTFLPICPSLPPYTALECGLNFTNSWGRKNLVVYNNKLHVATNGKYFTWDGVNLDTIKHNAYYLNTLEVYNGALYAGGRKNDGTQVRILKWDGFNWIEIQGLVSSGPGNQQFIEAMQVYNSELYVTGTISSIGGIAINNNIAKWNGTTWSSVGNIGSINVGLSMCVYNNELYLSGSFYVFINNHTPPYNAVQDVLKWNGTTWSDVSKNTSLHSGIGDAVLNVIGYNNNIYATGNGQSFPNPIQNLAWLNPSVSGINDIISESSIVVYPNPSSNTVYLELPKELNATTISIYSSTGAFVYSGKYSNQVDVSNFASGVYFLTIPTETGTLRKGFVVDHK